MYGSYEVLHYTTNSTNSDTLATANEVSTTINTFQTNSTAATIPSLNVQDTQPYPPPYTVINVPGQTMAINVTPYGIDKEKNVIDF